MTVLPGDDRREPDGDRGQRDGGAIAKHERPGEPSISERLAIERAVMDDDDSSALTPDEKRVRASISKFTTRSIQRTSSRSSNAERETDVEKIKGVYFDLANAGTRTRTRR